LAVTNDPASIVGDLGGRAISVLQNGDTAAAKQEQFHQLFRQYFDVEACARFALGTYWRTATTLQRQEFVELYEDYVVVLDEAPQVRNGGAWGTAVPLRWGTRTPDAGRRPDPLRKRRPRLAGSPSVRGFSRSS
jgi:hypothetical protein